MPRFTHTKEQVQAMRERPTERWTADADGNVYDADFEHDVMLKLDGDFKSQVQRIAFAERVAAALNKAMPFEPRGSVPEPFSDQAFKIQRTITDHAFKDSDDGSDYCATCGSLPGFHG